MVDLVHVVMDAQSLIAEGITSLVRNSSNLMTLYLKTDFNVNEECFNATLKKEFSKEDYLQQDTAVQTVKVIFHPMC